MPSLPETREDPKLDLAVESLRRGGTLHLKAWGMSMLPSVWPGDLLTIQAIARDEVLPGEIVVLLRKKRLVIHRLIERRQVQGRTLWITRGDAIWHNDPPAPETALLGRLVRIQRGQRDFVPSRRVSLLRAALARVLGRWNGFRNFALRIQSARQSGRAGTAGFFHGVFESVRSRTSPQ